MGVIRSVIAAFSTFSKIPVPSAGLDEKDFRYTLCFFPMVGAVIALLEWCVYTFCVRFGIGSIFRACVMCAVPLIVTGGIHLDGFCDTSDALSSYQPAQKKLEILKDAHIGAFAVIRLLVLSLLYMAAVSEVCDIFIFGITFVMSRAVTAFSVVVMKPAKKTGMGAAEKESSNRKAVCISSFVWLALCIIAAYCLDGVFGLMVSVVMAAVCILIYFLYKKKMYRELGGFTGDTSGWFLCVLETVSAYICVASTFLMTVCAAFLR